VATRAGECNYVLFLLMMMFLALCVCVGGGCHTNASRLVTVCTEIQWRPKQVSEGGGVSG
jgi:hypothetical protein